MDFKLLTDKTYNNPYINQRTTKYSHKEKASNTLIMTRKLLLNIKIVYQIGKKQIKLVKKMTNRENIISW